MTPRVAVRERDQHDLQPARQPGKITPEVLPDVRKGHTFVVVMLNSSVYPTLRVLPARKQ
jgi:hypothetical protein